MPQVSKRSAVSDGEQFARPLYDTIRDLEQTYEVNITVEMRPAGRRGEFEVVLAAYPQSSTLGARPVALVSKDWPHATVQSVPALMYNLAFKLGRLIEDWHNDLGREQALYEGNKARGRR